MTIKYVGPKPLISHTGISFDIHKEDKYVYLRIVVQLIDALDHDYFEDRRYAYEADGNRITNDDIVSTIRKHHPEMEKIVESRIKFMEHEIDHDLTRAKSNTVLDEIERETLYKNIAMMKDYLLQREANKAVYYEALEILAEIIKRGHIDYVIAPMFEKFVHVFHSVQGVLMKQKVPILSEIEIYQEEGQLKVKLDLKGAMA